MKSYLVDTSVIIDFLRGKKHAVEILRSIDGDIASSYICLSELYEGVYRSTKKSYQEELILEYFGSLSTVYGIDEHVAKKFGEVRAYLKRKGRIIEDLDLFLAATCLVYDLTLVTLNQKHFAHISDLTIYPINRDMKKRN